MRTLPNASAQVVIRPTLCRQIIEAVGGEQDDDGRWVFPDDSSFWVLDEATSHAIEALPTVVFDAMGTS